MKVDQMGVFGAKGRFFQQKDQQDAANRQPDTNALQQGTNWLIQKPGNNANECIQQIAPQRADGNDEL